MSIRTYNVSELPRTPGVYSVLVDIHGVQHPRSPEHPEIFAYWDGVDKWSCWETSEYHALRAKMCGPQVRYPWKEITKRAPHKTEAQRIADGLLAETSKFGTPSVQRGLLNGAIQELRRLDAALDAELANRDVLDKMLTQCIAERDQLRAQLAKAGEEERESIAKWYADEGWLLDEDDIPAAIRARSNT